MHRVIFSLLFFIPILSNSILGQYHFIKSWDKRFGGTDWDALTTFIMTSDSGYLIGGSSKSDNSGEKTQSSQGEYDYWIVKIDLNGTKQWDKRFGGQSGEGLSDLIQTSDGGFLLGGHSYSGIGGDKTEVGWGGLDYWIVKIDLNGNKQWDNRYGGFLDEQLATVKTTDDSGFILGGSSNSPIGGNKTENNWDSTHFYNDGWVVKIDAGGNKQWDKRLGGNEQDGLSAIIQTKDGGYLLGGYSASDSSGDKGENSWGYGDFWLIKVDSIGHKEWDKHYGGTSGEYLSSMLTTIDGGYLLAGTSYSDSSGEKTENNWGVYADYWIIKIDSGGSKLWDKSYGGSDDDQLVEIIPTKDSGYLLSGRSGSNVSGDKSESNLGAFQTWLIKIDSVGYKQWDKTILTTGFDGSAIVVQPDERCYVMAISTNGGIGGYKSQPNWDTTNATYDYWIIKFCMDTVTSINGSKQITDNHQLQVYPNPFTTDLSITLHKEDLHEATFTITTLTGQVIYHKEETDLATGYAKMLDLSYLPNGVYFVTVAYEDVVVSEKVVKIDSR